MITSEKAALFIACDFSLDRLVRYGTSHDKVLATRQEWAVVLDYVESVCRIRRRHLVEHSPQAVRTLHEREKALLTACENESVFQTLWEAVKRHYEEMDREPNWFERVMEYILRRL